MVTFDFYRISLISLITLTHIVIYSSDTRMEEQAATQILSEARQKRIEAGKMVPDNYNPEKTVVNSFKVEFFEPLTSNKLDVVYVPSDKKDSFLEILKQGYHQSKIKSAVTHRTKGMFTFSNSLLPQDRNDEAYSFRGTHILSDSTVHICCDKSVLDQVRGIKVQ